MIDRLHSSEEREDVYAHFYRGLTGVHAELRAGLDEIIKTLTCDAPDDQLRLLVESFSTTLLNHHRSEDVFFFPAFRAAGKLRSSDIAFLDARDHEHVPIHRLCLELQSLAGMRATKINSETRNRVLLTSSELAALSDPHFAAEEKVLTVSHLPYLISPSQLAAVHRDMGMNWNRRK